MTFKMVDMVDDDDVVDNVDDGDNVEPASVKCPRKEISQYWPYYDKI